jgi:Flp pilus assembly protein TadG
VCTLRHRILDERGQSAVEFALVLPLLLLVLFAVVEFARAYNAYNDLNQMAANGARAAAVGRYPGTTQLIADEADTATARGATVTENYSGGADATDCVVGGSVTVQAQAPISIASIVKVGGTSVGTINLTGTATMRVERCPS